MGWNEGGRGAGCGQGTAVSGVQGAGKEQRECWCKRAAPGRRVQGRHVRRGCSNTWGLLRWYQTLVVLTQPAVREQGRKQAGQGGGGEQLTQRRGAPAAVAQGRQSQAAASVSRPKSRQQQARPGWSEAEEPHACHAFQQQPGSSPPSAKGRYDSSSRQAGRTHKSRTPPGP